MADGVAEWFNAGRGFGLIEVVDGPDVFLYHSAFNRTGLKSLNEGDKVTLLHHSIIPCAGRIRCSLRTSSNFK